MKFVVSLRVSHLEVDAENLCGLPTFSFRRCYLVLIFTWCQRFRSIQAEPQVAGYVCVSDKLKGF